MKNLPACDLVDVLRLKGEARTDINFDYLARLHDLRARVSSEVRSINELFPEYTPHDEEYHLSRLFHVADTVIERHRYEEMNATELFVFACGLYAHDWGMAVSQRERQLILNGTPDDVPSDDIALLPYERSNFKRFLAERGIEPSAASTAINDDWREYIRLTHAARSAAR